jgi:hypothetical protein
MIQHVYKIWDKRFKTYTVNQGRISNNNFHPGRVYIHLKDVESCMKLCDEFYGDADEKEVHQFTLADREVIDI